MTLTFVSNYINHHQIPVSNCLYQALGSGYHFVQTEPMEEERRAMGWGQNGEKLPYLVCSYDQPELVRQLLMDSDVVVFGGCQEEELILPRIEAEKPVLRYSERIYKEGQWKFITPRGLRQKYHDHIRFARKNVYMLCAGGYVASDFHLIHAYPHKLLKWGYFPAFKPYPGDNCHENRLQSRQLKHPVTGMASGSDTETAPVILWAGRFIDWKHPELAIRLMAELYAEGIPAQLRMVGGGIMEKELRQQVGAAGIDDCVTFCGYMQPEQVREEMERADIFLFTSNYKEGWGAVLNESMNSGCAVVADAGIGAVPFLLKHGENGFVYPDGNYDSLKESVCRLLKDQELRLRLGTRAYETIQDLWNPMTAADRLLELCRQLTAEGRLTKLQEQGPGSPAEIISPGFWK